MASNFDKRALRYGGSSPVDGLALSVISRVSTSPNKRRDRRIEIGARMLISAVMAKEAFDQDQMKSDLQAFRISLTDIVDYCIPMAAAEIGAGWVDNTVSFTKVSSATARLYGLCKSIGQEWDNIRSQMNARSILLATVEREDHILGPAVLADQLRRRGHSVKILPNCSGPNIADLLRSGDFDCLMVSVSSLQVFEASTQAIQYLREQTVSVPIILGGAYLGFASKTLDNTGADLVTNDIDKALDLIVGDDISLRVAE